MMIVIDLFYFSRWYNLTITNPSYDNLGEYLCVAENNGGVMESKVTLTFDDPSNFIDRTGGKHCFSSNNSFQNSSFFLIGNVNKNYSLIHY